jgi:hypothetical protein
MRPLTLDDLLPLPEYSSRRREFFESQGRYLDRYRRVRLGPRLTLVFENRQTLWFRVQEVIRVARLGEPERIAQELEVYNRLLPRPDSLQAALLIEVIDERRLTEELSAWQTLRGDEVCLRVGERCCPAELITCRPEDRAAGVAHWVQFAVDAEGRRLLADRRLPAVFAVSRPSYQHHSSPLSEEVRQSLLDDLELSDRD